MEVKGMVADTPGNSTFFTHCASLICLAFDAEIHNVVTADGTVFDNDIPRP